MNILKQQHKIISIKSKRIYDNLLHFDEIANHTAGKEQIIGFYYLFLINYLGIDLQDCKGIIIDNEHCRIVENISNDDLGVDAVYIDEKELNVILFSFKYAASFNSDRTPSSTAGFDCSRFILALNDILDNNQTDKQIKKNFSEKTANTLIRIAEKFRAGQSYSISLLLVSNSSILNPSDIPQIQALKQLGLETVEQFILPDFFKLFNQQVESIKASLLIKPSEHFTYQESPSLNPNFVIIINLIDLIRITCDVEAIRIDSDFDIDNLSNPQIHKEILYENVRGFMQKSKFNEEIYKSLQNEPSKFFLYNNGITFIAKSISPVNKFRGTQINPIGLQLVNGGQTLKTIYNFIANEPNWKNDLRNAFVLCRFLLTSEDHLTSNQIARFTNSQNPISKVDLKSLDPIQVNLEEFLLGHRIAYIRKSGDYNKDLTSCTTEISISKLGQILFSIHKSPYNSSSNKSRIFEDDSIYKELFHAENLFDDSLKYIELFQEIKDVFTNKSATYSDQKAFYIIHACINYQYEIDKAFDILEQALSTYQNQDIPDARKLIRGSFYSHYLSLLSLQS